MATYQAERDDERGFNYLDYPRGSCTVDKTTRFDGFKFRTGKEIYNMNE